MSTNLEPKAVMPMRFWCQKILPAVYDDSLSYYEAVCRIGDKLNEVISVLNESDAQLADIQQALEDLQQEFEDFKNGGFDDYFQEKVEQWIDDNLEFIFTHVVKQVYFGLNEQGYFVAYIPDGWSDIQFDTGMDYSLDTYGRLMLRWNVNNESETVNQTPEAR